MDATEPKPEPKPSPMHPSLGRLCDHECCEHPFDGDHLHLFVPAECPLCTWKELM